MTRIVASVAVLALAASAPGQTPPAAQGDVRESGLLGPVTLTLVTLR